MSPALSILGRLSRSLIVGALCLAAPAFAQNTGRIEGKILDRETGEPLIAAQVMVESTDLGSFAREDGSYFIDEVPAGTHRITTEYLGYEKKSREVVVPPDEVAMADFGLASSMVDSPLIVAIVERPKWTPPEKVAAVMVEVSRLPRGLPEMPSEVCVAESVKRSAHIVGGRWELPHEITLLRCGEPPPPCPQDSVARRRAAR